jgi:hypothetical protein
LIRSFWFDAMILTIGSENPKRSIRLRIFAADRYPERSETTDWPDPHLNIPARRGNGKAGRTGGRQTMAIFHFYAQVLGRGSPRTKRAPRSSV